MSDPWLAGPLTSTAYGWRLERRDGVTLGFTSHDRDVQFGDLLLRASPGMVPSTIIETIGLEAGGLDISGAITADALRADEIEAGLWDGARMSVFLFDWSNPDAGSRMLAVGDLGAVSISDNAFEVEFNGPAARLNMPVAPSSSPTCRAAFCDKDCGLSSHRFRHETKVTAVIGSAISIAPIAGLDPARLAYGELRWLAGRNVGQRRMIVSAGATSIQLVMPPAFAVPTPSTVELFEGCDKTIATCSARFANAINFRGEPYLPGNDLLTRYPGA
jgi:uncharacterized phage protein (TIGR02218 family)